MVKTIIVLLTVIAFFQISAIAIAGESMQDENTQLIAYYFYGNVRCRTCHNLEQYAKEAIYNNFKDELDKGVLVFKTVNVEEESNEHFVNDYKLYSRALILSLVKNGEEVKHKNLVKIWEYVRNKEKDANYVKSEIKTLLKEIE